MRTVMTASAAILLLLVPAAAQALTVTVIVSNENNQGHPEYVGAAAKTANDTLTISWTTDTAVTNGTFHVTVGQKSTDAANELSTGSYSSASSSVDVTVQNIVGHDTAKGDDGEKDIYVTIDTSDTATDAGTSGTTSASGKVTLHFDTTPPGAPTIDKIEAGEQNLKVSMSFSGSVDADKGGFRVYYRPKDDSGEYASVDAETTSITVGELENGVEYEVRAAQLDYAKNEGEKSEASYGTPVPVQDFYEFYRANGGADKGGFCFVATAAYGSPAHPFVGVLREFRDRRLLTNDPGRAFVETYYRMSPPVAGFIRERPALRFAAGVGLLPLVAVAWAGLHPLLSLAGVALAVAGGRFALRRKRRRDGGRAAVCLAFFAAVAALSIAPAPAGAESPRTMELEVKFGPFFPNHLDEEAGLTKKPYETIFGSSSRMLTRWELQYIVFQKVGTVSVGGGGGFWQALGKGRALDPKTGKESKSTDTTVLNVVPLTLDVAYRFDWLAQKKDIPIMPFVKTGLDYYFWWVLNSTGDVASTGDGRGAGGKFGWHVSFGLALLLDWLDSDTANDFDVNVGVNNTYLFAEATIARVDNFGAGGLNLGSETFLFGLLFEL